MPRVPAKASPLVDKKRQDHVDMLFREKAPFIDMIVLRELVLRENVDTDPVLYLPPCIGGKDIEQWQAENRRFVHLFQGPFPQPPSAAAHHGHAKRMWQKAIEEWRHQTEVWLLVEYANRVDRVDLKKRVESEKLRRPVCPPSGKSQ